MGINRILIGLLALILLAMPLISADIDIFDNLNGTGYNATFKNFFGDFIGNGSQLTGLTESQIIDLQHTTDTNRSDAEINTLIDNRVIQSYIEALGFVVGAHTVDTNRSDADILSVASVYNETDWVLNQSYLTSESDPIFTLENSSIWSAINNKLESTDQRYNDTDIINAVNTTSNIEGLGFVTGAHTVDTNRSDAEINTLIDNRVIQSYIEALGFVTGAHTIDTNRSDEDILSVASVYNDTAAINAKLDKTDQRYNETDLINSVNTTANIESLGFVTGSHTVDTNRSDQDILDVASVYNDTNLINNSWNQSLADTLYMDINQDDWVDTSGDSMSGSLTFTQAAANFIHNFEFDFFPWGQTTVGLRISNDSSNLILQALGSSNININDDLSVKGVDVGTWLHNQTEPANQYTDNQLTNYLELTDQRYNETNWVQSQGYLTSESDPNLWTTSFNSTGDNRWLDDTTIGNCSIDNSCSSITYDSETANWDKDNSDDLTASDLPLANKTSPHCSNITGTVSDLCTLTDTTIGNCSGEGSCSAITYDSETANWDKNNTDDFDGVWNSLTNVPAGFSDDIDNDTTYSYLSNFTDDLGNRGYTSLSNFSDDIGVSVDWDECSDASACGWITDGNTNWDNTYGFITNTVSDLVNYYLKTDLYNKTEIDNSLASQDECSEITGCVENAITDANDSVDSSELDNLCSTNDKILKRISGAWQCADDATGGGGGNPFDQSLNTTDNVTFNKINANDWNNITITESQISNLDHYTDSDIDGNEAAFNGWDKNTGDDFDGVWSSLTGVPAGFSDDIDNDTIYTNGSGISLTGTQFNHSDTSSQSSSDNSGRTYIQDILLDSFGHVTSITTAVESVVDTTSFFIDTDAEVSTEINEGETVLFSDSTGMSVTRSGNTISFSTTLGTAIEKGEISNSGTLSFDWIDDEIADTLTIGSSSTVADGALSSNVPLKNTANDFSQEQTFSAGINVTSTNQLKIGACYEQWNGTCLNTYCSGTLIQSIGCA